MLVSHFSASLLALLLELISLSLKNGQGIPQHLLQQQQSQRTEAGTGGGEPATGPAAPNLGQVSSGSASATPSTTPAQAAAVAADNVGGNAPSRAGNLFEAAAAAQQGRGGNAAGRGAGGATGLGDLDEDGEGGTSQVLDLGNPAMLAQLRQLVQQNPAALSPLIQALAQSNPQLANAMAEDPEGVLNLLASGAAGGGLGGEEGEESVSLPSMEELSAEDRTAVEQVCVAQIMTISPRHICL